jgi:hypothetical protein
MSISCIRVNCDLIFVTSFFSEIKENLIIAKELGASNASGNRDFFK